MSWKFFPRIVLHFWCKHAEKNIKCYFINFFATKNNSLRSNNVEGFYNFSKKNF